MSTPASDPGVGYDPRLTWKTGLIGIAYAFGSIVVLGIFFAIALGLGADEDNHAFNFIANLAQDLLLVGAALLAVRGAVDHVTLETLGFRGIKWSGVGWAVLALVTFLIISAVYASLIHIEKENVKDTGLGGPLLAIFAVAIAPIVEETFFRGFLFRSFRNGMGVIGAALLTGLLFGGVHAGSAPVAALPLLALFGVMLALLFEHTRSLWPCIVSSHALQLDGDGRSSC